jgi:hypothetical protein
LDSWYSAIGNRESLRRVVAALDLAGEVVLTRRGGHEGYGCVEDQRDDEVEALPERGGPRTTAECSTDM